MNTHSNPDHCFGNELLPAAAEIYASAATAAEMGELSPEMLHGLKSAPGMPPELADFVAHAFGPFDFEGITLRRPSQTFDGQLDLRVGERDVSGDKCCPVRGHAPAEAVADDVVDVDIGAPVKAGQINASATSTADGEIFA